MPPGGPTTTDTGPAALATLADQLSRGVSLAGAAVDTTRALLDSEQAPRARALAVALERQVDPAVGALCGGICAHALGRHVLAVSKWADVSDALVTEYCLLAYAESCLAVDDEHSRSRLLRLVEAATCDPATTVQLAARLLVGGQRETGLALHRRLAASEVATLSPQDQQTAGLLAEVGATAPLNAPEGVVRMGVLDYRQPDQSRASDDLGDYVQTLAVLGNVTRHSGLEITGADGLGALASQLQRDTPPELRIDDLTGQVHLVPVHRDFSSFQRLPAKVWMVAYGSHLHQVFGLRYDFPYHPSLRPIFVSFHVRAIEALTPEAVAYLRRYAPIGCRDWSTVYLLRSAGVDAFFTGCVTTTVDTAVSPASPPAHPAPVCAVDVPARVRANMTATATEMTHADPSLPQLGLVAGVRAARDRLSYYRRHHRRMVTSRLHAYLPSVALGLKVRFVPRRPNDARYPGLRGLDPGAPELAAMQERIRGLLATMFRAIVSGADERDVYATWREITRPLVAEAELRHRSVLDEPVPDVDPAPLLAAACRGRATFGPRSRARDVVDVALSLDANLAEQLPVCLDTMLERASRPVRVWVMTRGLSSHYQHWLASAFPDTELVVLPCDDADYGEVRRMFSHITVSTMDRLLLPELVTEADRVVYIDVDALVLGDVAELADTPLRGCALAARPTHNFGHLFTWRSAQRLPPERADELRSRATLRHPFPFSGLNAGIVVMDTAQLRAQRFTAMTLAWVRRYGLNDQDALMAFAGPNLAPLPARWNSWPLKEPLHDPAVVHYIGPAKPWKPLLCEADSLWRERAASVQERCSWPPPR